MHHWTPSLLNVVEFYFTSNLVVAGILVAVSALAVSFAVFALSKSHGKKSGSMLFAMLISTSLWVFVISSLLFCVDFVSAYAHSPVGSVFSVVKLAIIPTVLIGPIAFYFMRNRAMKKVYPYFTFTRKASESGSDSSGRSSSLFSSLLTSAKLSGIDLSVVPGVTNLPASAALEWKGEKTIAISSTSIQALDDDELKAVLAHELGHIVHRDSFRKNVATAYRSAFIFDPVAHFVEAAIYRDGELYADEYSARLTGNPAALASALIKIHESMTGIFAKIPITQAASLLLNDHESSIFSKQPSLTLRIKKLLEMESEVKAGILKTGFVRNLLRLI